MLKLASETENSWPSIAYLDSTWAIAIVLFNHSDLAKLRIKPFTLPSINSCSFPRSKFWGENGERSGPQKGMRARGARFNQKQYLWDQSYAKFEPLSEYISQPNCFKAICNRANRDNQNNWTIRSKRWGESRHKGRWIGSSRVGWEIARKELSQQRPKRRCTNLWISNH